MLKWLSSGTQIETPKGILYTLYAGSIALTIYILWYNLLAPSNRHLHGAIFIFFTLPICFVTFSANQRLKKATAVDYGLAFASMSCAAYYIWNRDFYHTYIEGMEPLGSMEILVGLGLCALAAEACRRCVGWGLTSVTIVLLLYCAFGQYIGGEFGHSGITLDYFISRQTVGEDAVFGDPLNVAATYAFLFVLFGTMFQYSGGGQLIYDISAALTKRSVAGLPKACVVSSGLYGSVSGSPVADVVTTGPITIPMMIRSGITRVRAGGIESAASAGGAFLPPVMGAVAFLMVEFTGLTYLEVCIAAMAPALLYYVGVFALIQFQGLKEPGIGNADEEPPRLLTALRQGWHHLIPIVTLIVLLVQGYTVAFVGSGAVLAVIVSSWLNTDHGNKIGPRGFAECAYETVMKMAVLGAAVLCAGMILGAIDMSGMTGKFTALLMGVTGGSYVSVLLAASVVLILLGMGMPTPAVYIMGVALIAPVLIGSLGIGLMEAHMFMLFFASMSAITPPMAVACFASATIAKASPMAIGVYACRVGSAGFILPFYMVLNPGIVMQGSAFDIGIDVLAGLALVLGVALAQSGYSPRPGLRLPVRIAASAGVVLCMLPNPFAQIAGVVLAGGSACFAQLYSKPKMLSQVRTQSAA